MGIAIGVLLHELMWHKKNLKFLTYQSPFDQLDNYRMLRTTILYVWSSSSLCTSSLLSIGASNSTPTSSLYGETIKLSFGLRLLPLIYSTC